MAFCCRRPLAFTESSKLISGVNAWSRSNPVMTTPGDSRKVFLRLYIASLSAPNCGLPRRVEWRLWEGPNTRCQKTLAAFKACHFRFAGKMSTLG